MNYEFQKKLSKIIQDIGGGLILHYEAVKQVNKLYSGLRLDGEEIILECFQCGAGIVPFAIDSEVALIFDRGVPDSKVTPGEPAIAYIICEACNRSNKNKEPME